VSLNLYVPHFLHSVYARVISLWLSYSDVWNAIDLKWIIAQCGRQQTTIRCRRHSRPLLCVVQRCCFSAAVIRTLIRPSSLIYQIARRIIQTDIEGQWCDKMTNRRRNHLQRIWPIQRRPYTPIFLQFLCRRQLLRYANGSSYYHTGLVFNIRLSAAYYNFWLTTILLLFIKKRAFHAPFNY